MCDSKHNVLKIAYLQQNHDIQSCSVAKSRPTLYDPKTSTPGLPVLHSQSSLKFKPMESVLPSNHLILCHTLLLPSIFPSVGVFCTESGQFFASGGQSIGASASVLPMNIQDWFSLGLTSLIFLLSKGFSRVFSNTTVQKHQFFGAQLSLWSNSHIHTWLLEKL